jgi:hypothetical protein
MTDRSPLLRRSLLPFGVALATALLASCSPAEPKAPKLAIDACQLFTYADAVAIVGEGSVGGTLSSTLDDATGHRDLLQCLYTDGAGDQPHVLALLVRPFDTRSEARQIFEATRSRLGALAGVEPINVPGIGEAASWGGGNLGQLHLLHHNYELIVTGQGWEGNVGLEAAKKVAARVLPRLTALEQKGPEASTAAKAPATATP